MKKLIIIIFITLINCSTPKDICYERLRFKGTRILGETSTGACLGYLAYENSANLAEERGMSGSSTRILANASLINCLYLYLEEQKCEKESEYIPHFGY